jgi:low affinity Fe/Cu permease
MTAGTIGSLVLWVLTFVAMYLLQHLQNRRIAALHKQNEETVASIYRQIAASSAQASDCLVEIKTMMPAIRLAYSKLQEFNKTY